MSSRNAGAATRPARVAPVALVILLGLVVGTLGLVLADLYAVGVLILFLGGVGAAVLAGDYLIRYFSSRQPPA
jgi:type IV secretory pathway TrbD component